MKNDDMFSTFLIFAFVILFSGGCKKESTQQNPSLPVISAVTVHKVRVPMNFEYTGRISASRETDIRAHIGGILLHHNFLEGKKVKEGDLLFEIDPAPWVAEVEQQKALVAQAQAIYDQSVRDARRAEELFRKNVQSVAFKDQILVKRDASAASLRQMQAALASAQLNLSYTKIRAPVDGIVGRQIVSEGNLIGTTSSNFDLLTTIIQNDPVYVNFSYTDMEARKIKSLIEDMRARGKDISDLQVRIIFEDGSVYEKLGIVDFTSSVLDTKTGTLNVRAVVDNPQNLLIPGQFVRVSIIGLAFEEAILLPEEALLQDSTGSFVYCINAQQGIEKHSVSVAQQLPDRRWLLDINHILSKGPPVSIIDIKENKKTAENNSLLHEKDFRDYSGLNEGDKVVTEGHLHINMALKQLSAGRDLKVLITTLDGKDYSSPIKGDKISTSKDTIGKVDEAKKEIGIK